MDLHGAALAAAVSFAVAATVVPAGGAFAEGDEPLGAASITIVNDAAPDSEQDFAFTGDLGEPFGLDDDSDATLESSKTFRTWCRVSTRSPRTAVPGWDLTKLDCTPNETTDLETRTATITLDPGEDVTCTFTNTQRGSITIVNDADPDSAQDSRSRGI